MRIAFVPQPSFAWLGGVSYYRNLLGALRAHAPEVERIVFVDPALDPKLKAILDLDPGVELIEDAAFSPAAIRRRTMLALLTGQDKVSNAAFAAARADIVFETNAFYGARPAPAPLAWFADFQHRRLPALFRRQVRWRRDLLVRAWLRNGRTLMLSSRDAERDASRFFPRSMGRTAVVRFAVPPPAFPLPEPGFKARYTLDRPFFYAPNQFWRHKNHELLIDALALLPPNRRPLIAASGATEDPREPGRLTALSARAERLGVGSDFRILGLIPFPDVIALARTSCAVINPSHFEGWSTTVEECKSLGVRMLLSDISVHREQADGMARFFSAEDPGTLAEAMEATLAGNGPPAPDPRETPERIRNFAASFVAAAQKAAAAR